MDTGRARGLSLWLMPEGSVRDRLAALVGRLATRLGTEPFPPHVTLLSGIADAEDDVLRAAAALAPALPPLGLSLGPVLGGEEHFRCLFVRLAADEAIRSAHAAAARAFGREPDPAFLPHLSLVYGALPPETKRRLAVEVADEVAVSFEAARLHVFRTEGRAGDWREVAAFRLGPEVPRPG
jgi:2'-5' RNA ligase